MSYMLSLMVILYWENRSFGVGKKTQLESIQPRDRAYENDKRRLHIDLEKSHHFKDSNQCLESAMGTSSNINKITSKKSFALGS